jgi:predicted ABC-type ATPase
LDLLIKAKECGFFIRVIYVLTVDSQINVYRVKQRFSNGGHDVPSEKVISRYNKALQLIPELVKISDICHIYDNSLEFSFRIFKKRKDEFFYWENSLWQKDKIENLVGIKF